MISMICFHWSDLNVLISLIPMVINGWMIMISMICFHWSDLNVLISLIPIYDFNDMISMIWFQCAFDDFGFKTATLSDDAFGKNECRHTDCLTNLIKMFWKCVASNLWTLISTNSAWVQKVMTTRLTVAKIFMHEHWWTCATSMTTYYKHWCASVNASRCKGR